MADRQPSRSRWGGSRVGSSTRCVIISKTGRAIPGAGHAGSGSSRSCSGGPGIASEDSRIRFGVASSSPPRARPSCCRGGCAGGVRRRAPALGRHGHRRGRDLPRLPSAGVTRSATRLVVGAVLRSRRATCQHRDHPQLRLVARRGVRLRGCLHGSCRAQGRHGSARLS